jgi:hypothetical protein
MKSLSIVLALVISTYSVPSRASTRSPIDLVWVIRAGPLSSSETYLGVREELVRLVDLAVSLKARATILVSGDFAEEALERKHSPQFGRWLREGFEIGTYVGLKRRAGVRRWVPVTGTGRFGDGGYDGALTKDLWKQHREWVDRLVGAARNRAVDADSFRCSTEISLSRENHFEVSFCRAGAALFSADELGGRPWRPSGSDERGAELATDSRTGLMEIDLTGQTGDPFDRAGDWSVLRLREAFFRKLGETSGVRVMPFLTLASPSTRPLFFEVERWVRFLAKDTVGVNRRARWSTASSVRTAATAWEAVSGLPSVQVYSGPEPQPVALRVRNAQLEGVTRLRAGRTLQPTCGANLEFRWWGLNVWRAAQRSINPAAVERVEPSDQRSRLDALMREGPSPELFAEIDRTLEAFESLARG